MSKTTDLTKNVYTNVEVLQCFGFDPDEVFKQQGIELNDSANDINTNIRARHNRYLITRMNIEYMNIDYSAANKVDKHNLIRYIIDDINEFSEVNTESGKKYYASINYSN